MAVSSSRKSFILMKGSLPFWVSMCQGLGRARRSDTEPWDRPSTASPNSLWLMLYCDRISLMRRVRSSELRWAYWSN